MAITVNVLNKISAVYSDIILTATEVNATSGLTYLVKVKINDIEVSSFRSLPNLQSAVDIKLNQFLQDYVESTISTHTTPYQVNGDNILKYSVTITSLNSTGGTISTLTTPNYYAYNGVVQDWEDFNVMDYVTRQGTKAHFLSKRRAPRTISLTGEAYLSLFHGNLGLTTNPTQITLNIKKYNKNGTTNIYTNYVATGFATASTFSINLSPSAINTKFPNAINEDTVWYEIYENDSTILYPVRYIIQNETKINRPITILYINSFGVVDTFEFNKTKEVELDIQRKEFEQSGNKRQFGTEVTYKVDVSSDWITEAQSLELEELWVSPALVVKENGKYIPVLNKTDKQKIKSKYNEKMIRYMFSFDYATKYRVQKY
jgi:hypothetical protein